MDLITKEGCDEYFIFLLVSIGVLFTRHLYPAFILGNCQQATT